MRARLLAVLLALLPVLIAPLTAPALAAKPEKPDTRSASDVLVIAHRGASGLAPEHTVASYDLGESLGSDYLEQDAQITADGVLVSIHDTTLDRTARGPAQDCTGLVRTKTLEQLRRCDVGSWFNERFPDRARPEYVGLRIPTMSEVFERYGDDTNYHVEIKDNAPQTTRELLRLMDVHGLRGPAHTDWRVLIQSFSPADLQLVRALDPALPTVQLLFGLPPAGPAQDTLLDGIATYADGIGPSSRGVDAALVEAAQERCLQVQPYTVDDPEQLRRLIDAGVDGIFTNRPDVMNDVLDRWQARPNPDLRNAAAAAERSRTCRG
jgi:glycerophosphoryl diester phosphodiesterase